MSNHIALLLQSKQALTQKQTQRLIMSAHMQQALSLLQMPLQELAVAVEHEIETNPVLDYVSDDEWVEESETHDEQYDVDLLDFDNPDFSLIDQLDIEWEPSEYKQPSTSNSIDYVNAIPDQNMTLANFLMEQARQVSDKEKLSCLKKLIGNLDESGYLTTPIKEIAILEHIGEEKLLEALELLKEFEPFGVGAANLKECLLIQLKCLGKKKSLAFRVVENCYEDLLHNKIPEIQRRLKCSKKELDYAIYHEIAKLSFQPGSLFQQRNAMPIVPDILIEERNGKLVVISNEEEYLPNLCFNRDYLALLSQKDVASDSKEFIRQKVVSAKWLLKNIHHRGETLKKIAYSLLKRQEEFFQSPEGKLAPLTMITLAEELQLHESTIARAVADKYIYTPRGLFPLRFFFTSALNSSQGEVSSTTAKEIIQEFIKNENKKKPLSDQVLSDKLKKRGIQCSRRTVSKYRQQLHLGNAHQRKKH